MRIPCSIQISFGKSLVTLKSYMVDLLLQTYTNNFLVHFFPTGIIFPLCFKMSKWKASYLMGKKKFHVLWYYFPIWNEYIYYISLLYLYRLNTIHIFSFKNYGIWLYIYIYGKSHLLVGLGWPLSILLFFGNIFWLAFQVFTPFPSVHVTVEAESILKSFFQSSQHISSIYSCFFVVAVEGWDHDTIKVNEIWIEYKFSIQASWKQAFFF